MRKAFGKVGGGFFVTACWVSIGLQVPWGIAVRPEAIVVKYLPGLPLEQTFPRDSTSVGRRRSTALGIRGRAVRRPLPVVVDEWSAFGPLRRGRRRLMERLVDDGYEIEPT